MIDLHCHILPGLDDGPATLDESLAMCRMAAQDGIKTIVAATHFRPGRYEPTAEARTRALQDLRQALAAERIVVEIVPAAEVTITPELASHLDRNDWLFINGTGKYFIAEFAQDLPPRNWNFLLAKILRSGRIPVLTHPERCALFAEEPGLLEDFVGRGGLVQVSAGSVIGETGEDMRVFTEFLLENNLVHAIATDAHSPSWRPPILSPAVSRAAMVTGWMRADALVNASPLAIIEGRPVASGPRKIAPTPPKRTSWLARFLGRE